MLRTKRPKKTWYQRLSTAWTVGAALMDSVFSSDDDLTYRTSNESAISADIPVLIERPERQRTVVYEEPSGSHSFDSDMAFQALKRPNPRQNSYSSTYDSDRDDFPAEEARRTENIATASRDTSAGVGSSYNRGTDFIDAMMVSTSPMSRDPRKTSQHDLHPRPVVRRSLLDIMDRVREGSVDSANSEDLSTHWALTIRENQPASSSPQSTQLFENICANLKKHIDPNSIQTVEKSTPQTKLSIGHCLIESSSHTLYAHQVQASCSTHRGTSLVSLEFKANPSHRDPDSPQKRLNRLISDLSERSIPTVISTASTAEEREKTTQKEVVKASLRSFNHPKVAIRKQCNTLDDLETVIGSIKMMITHADQKSQNISFDLSGVKVSRDLKKTHIGQRADAVLEAYKQKDSDKKALILDLQGLLDTIKARTDPTYHSGYRF